MAPRYRHGQYLVCRRPIPGLIIPNGTPGIFDETEISTFKLLRYTPKGVPIGEPINHSTGFTIFSRASVSVSYIVIGGILVD